MAEPSEWHDAAAPTREPSACSSAASEDFFEASPSRQRVPTPAAVASTPPPKPSTTGPPRAAQPDDDEVERELIALEAEAQDLPPDAEWAAEMAQYEKEFRPLERQLDAIQQQLAATQDADKESSQQLQLLHSKLSSPATLRRQQQQRPPAAAPGASSRQQPAADDAPPGTVTAAAAGAEAAADGAAAAANDAAAGAEASGAAALAGGNGTSSSSSAAAAAAAAEAEAEAAGAPPPAPPPPPPPPSPPPPQPQPHQPPVHSRHASTLSFGSIASDSQLESFGHGSHSNSDTELQDVAPGRGAAGPAAAAAAAAVGGAEGSPAGGGHRPQPQQRLPAISSGGGQGLLVRQVSGPVSPTAMAAVAPVAVAPPRSDLDLRRLNSSPEGSSGSPTDLGDAWATWASHRRHFFVLTSAGKPVYSLHGDEGALAGFMAIIQAVVSVVADQGDCLRAMSVGPTQLVVALRGHLYLVAVTNRGEGALALRRQLHLLHQAILMVVTNGVEKVLTRNPGYDVRQLLAGSSPALTALISSYTSGVGWLLEAVEPAAGLGGAERLAAAAALRAAVAAGGALYGVLLAGRQVVAVDSGRNAPLHPADLLLLANFANGNAALRQAESFAPLCLPNFQPGAMLHAYVGCLDAGASVFLLLLGASAGGFHALAAQRVLLEAELLQTGLLLRLRDALLAPDGGRPAIAALPPPAGGLPGRTCLWHYQVHWPQQHQHVCAAWPSGLLATQPQQEEVQRAYARLYCTAHAPVLSQHAAAASTGIGNGAGSASAGGAGPEPAGIGGLAGSILGLPSSMGSGGGASAMAAAATAASYVLPYAPPRSSRLVWVSTRRWVAVAAVHRELEVYAILDPLTDSDTAMRVTDALRKQYSDKGVQAGLLVPGWPGQ